MLSTLLNFEYKIANKTDMVSHLRVSQEGESKPKNPNKVFASFCNEVYEENKGRAEIENNLGETSCKWHDQVSLR